MPAVKLLVTWTDAGLSIQGAGQTVVDKGFAHALNGGPTHLQRFADVGIGPAGLIGFEQNPSTRQFFVPTRCRWR